MRSLLFLTGLALLCHPVSADATTLRQLDINALVQRAEDVVVGYAVESTSFWRNGRIFTETTLHVDDVWVGKAKASSELKIVTLGGRVGDLAQAVHGATQMPIDGTPVVLCLAKRKDNSHYVVGMAQGAFFVDTTTANQRVYRQLDHVRLVAGAAPPKALTSTTTPSTLADLRAAVLEAARDAQ